MSNGFLEAVTSLPTFLTSLPKQLAVAWDAAETITDIQQAVNLSGDHKIAKLQKVDESKVYKSIGRLLARMVVDLHIADGLSTSNIKNIAKRLTTDDEIRWWLTLADVDLLCRQIVEGRFGKFYNHFSEKEFYDCLIKYCNERSELHRIDADKSVTTPKESTLSMEELGYSIDKNGQLQVPEEMKDTKLAQPLYIYDDYGRKVGINPKGHFGKKANEDKIYNAAKAYMKENPNLTYDQAFEMAEAKLNPKPQNNQ